MVENGHQLVGTPPLRAFIWRHLQTQSVAFSSSPLGRFVSFWACMAKGATHQVPPTQNTRLFQVIFGEPGFEKMRVFGVGGKIEPFDVSGGPGLDQFPFKGTGSRTSGSMLIGGVAPDRGVV